MVENPGGNWNIESLVNLGKIRWIAGKIFRLQIKQLHLSRSTKSMSMAKMKRICVQRPVKKLPTRYFCEDSPPRKSVHISA